MGGQAQFMRARKDKKRRLDQDKKQDSKEKKGLLLGKKKCSFWL
jgi:hypothetical protein